MMTFSEEEMKQLQGAGKTVGQIGHRYMSEIYQLDRCRSPEEFLRGLRHTAMLGLSMGKREADMPYLENLDYLVVLATKKQEKNPNAWEELRDIILVFAASQVAYLQWNKSKKEGKLQ